MKKIPIFLSLLFMMFENAQAQSKYHVDIDYHYNLGFSEKIAGSYYGRNNYKMGGHSLRVIGRYDISHTLSAGLGVGTDRYTEVDFNTMPIYATVRYSPLKKENNAYVFTDIGYAVKISQSQNPGFTGKIGVGYLIPIAKHFGINFQIAYDFKDFREIATVCYNEDILQNIYYDTNSIRHSISFGVGLSF